MDADPAASPTQCFPDVIEAPPVRWCRAEGTESVPSARGALWVEYIAAHPLSPRGELLLCRVEAVSNSADAGVGEWVVVYRGPDVAGLSIEVGPCWWMEEAAWQAARQVYGEAVCKAWDREDRSAEMLGMAVLRSMQSARTVETAPGPAAIAAQRTAELMAPAGRPVVSELATDGKPAAQLVIAHREQIPMARRILRSAFLAGARWAEKRMLGDGPVVSG